MNDLSADDWPREKLLRHGAAAFGDNELVALVLGSGGPRAGALAVANELLRARGGLHGLGRSTCDDLAQVPGSGVANATKVIAAQELGRRTLADAPSGRVGLATPRDAAACLMPSFGSRGVEQFGVVRVDSTRRVLRTRVVTVGTLNSTVVQARDVFREAMLGSTTAVVVFHNHPSGDPGPSPDDIELTQRLVASGALMGIDLVDRLCSATRDTAASWS